MEGDELERAQHELEDAYRLFNFTSDPRLIDEAILRMRSAEMRLDYLTHAAMEPAQAKPLPWLGHDISQ